MRLILTFLFIGILFCSCKEAETEASADAVAMEMPAKAMYKEDVNYDMEVDSVDTEAVQNAPPMSGSSEEKIEQKSIKSGDLRFENSDMEETYGAVHQLIKKYNATVQSDSEDKDD